MGKTRIQPLSPLLPFVSALTPPWLVITVRSTLVLQTFGLWSCWLTEWTRFLGPGFHPHLPGFRHQFLAKALGATMWFFIFYRARCVTVRCILIKSDIPTHFAQARRREALGMSFTFRTFRLAHLCSVGIKSPMGGPWTRPPRRARSRTPLDPFLLHMCTIRCVTLPNKAPYLHREHPSRQVGPHLIKGNPQVTSPQEYICRFRSSIEMLPSNWKSLRVTPIP